MKKKQLLSGVMALLLSASLCACGGSKTAEGTSEAAGESRKQRPVILFQKEHQYQAAAL